MGGTYRAWNDTIRRWPPPNGWYRGDDGRWWAPGTGPNPPGRRPPPHPPSPAVRRDPGPRSTRLLSDDTDRSLDGNGNGTGHDNEARAGTETSPDRQPGLAACTTDTALLPLTAYPPVITADRPRKPRLITRLAAILAGVALGALTGAGVIGALVTTGHIDDLPVIAIDRPTVTTPLAATDRAPIEPFTAEPSTVATQAIISEPRIVDEPTARVARFAELPRIDDVANGPGPGNDLRSGLVGG